MQLQDYISELRDRISDNQTLIETHFSDSELTSFINRSRRMVNQMIPQYENQDYIIPDLWIDEYDLPSDFIAMKTVYNPYDNRYYPPTNKAKAEIFPEDFADTMVYQNLFYINEKRKRITFLKPPEKVPMRFEIKSFSRTTNTIVIDNCAGVGTLTSSGTSVTMSGETTVHLKAGYKITCSGDTIAISEITSDQTFTLASAPGTDWAAETYTVLKSDDTIPVITDWMSLKPYIQLKGSVAAKTGTWSAYATTLTLNNVTSLQVGMEITGAGIQKGTTILTIPSTTSITISKPTTASGSTTALNFYTYEYCRVSVIKANSDYTEYTLYISAWNLKDIDYDYTFAADDYVTMVTYVHEYISNPKPLASDTDEDRLPMEVQELVVIYAEALAFQRDNLVDRRAVALAEFNERLNNVQFAVYRDAMNTKNQERKYGS